MRRRPRDSALRHAAIASVWYGRRVSGGGEGVGGSREGGGLTSGGGALFRLRRGLISPSTGSDGLVFGLPFLLGGVGGSPADEAQRRGVRAAARATGLVKVGRCANARTGRRTRTARNMVSERQEEGKESGIAVRHFGGGGGGGYDTSEWGRMWHLSSPPTHAQVKLQSAYKASLQYISPTTHYSPTPPLSTL
jgi:hypothetical protein